MNDLKDQYGNNTSFPDSVMSDMTTRGLLGKWTEMIFSEVKGALFKYHMRSRNMDFGYKNTTAIYFNDAWRMIEEVTPVLEDLVNESIYGIEDIFLAVFGVGSDEVYALREFLRLHGKMGNWDEDCMWNDCKGDERLLRILTDKI
jgi:hypothetical protein